MKWLIKNCDTGYFFEADFAGWSWHKSKVFAYKFSDKDRAEEFVQWLIESGEKCEIEEYTK